MKPTARSDQRATIESARCKRLQSCRAECPLVPSRRTPCILSKTSRVLHNFFTSGCKTMFEAFSGGGHYGQPIRFSHADCARGHCHVSCSRFLCIQPWSGARAGAERPWLSSGTTFCLLAAPVGFRLRIFSLLSPAIHHPVLGGHRAGASLAWMVETGMGTLAWQRAARIRGMASSCTRSTRSPNVFSTKCLA
jgi:hypothetical protein